MNTVYTSLFTHSPLNLAGERDAPGRQLSFPIPLGTLIATLATLLLLLFAHFPLNLARERDAPGRQFSDHQAD